MASKPITKAHVHQLLWNLRASRNNALYAPEGSIWRTTAPTQIRNLEAELRRRDLPIPGQSTTDEEWEALLAWALKQ